MLLSLGLWPHTRGCASARVGSTRGMQKAFMALGGIAVLSVLVCTADGQGNKRCWMGHFTYAFCCDATLPAGNPDCWDKRRFTHQRCCIDVDDPLPPLHPVNPRAGKLWRVVCEKDLGGWMVHELTFYEDEHCEHRIRKHARMLESGHRRNYPPANAFDQWVKATDEYFWYSEEAAESAVVTGVGTAWLGLEFARPMEVKCVGLWHNNIPSVPVALQRWDHAQENWLDVSRWPRARGGEWVMLVVGMEERYTTTVGMTMTAAIGPAVLTQLTVSGLPLGQQQRQENHHEGVDQGTVGEL